MWSKLAETRANYWVKWRKFDMISVCKWTNGVDNNGVRTHNGTLQKAIASRLFAKRAIAMFQKMSMSVTSFFLLGE